MNQACILALCHSQEPFHRVLETVTRKLQESVVPKIKINPASRNITFERDTCNSPSAYRSTPLPPSFSFLHQRNRTNYSLEQWAGCRGKVILILEGGYYRNQMVAFALLGGLRKESRARYDLNADSLSGSAAPVGFGGQQVCEGSTMLRFRGCFR